jgi:hypothetical protein
MGQESANFTRLFERWLATTPLTLFHEAGKAGSRFAWVGSALALTRTRLGRDLALRALLLSLDVPRALDALSRAALALRSIDTEAFDHANGFVQDAIGRHKQLNQ